MFTQLRSNTNKTRKPYRYLWFTLYIMSWLTLKRANTTSILTAVMVPYVVAAWLDEEERDAT